MGKACFFVVLLLVCIVGGCTSSRVSNTLHQDKSYKPDLFLPTLYCVAYFGAPPAVLQRAIGQICREPGVDCSKILPGRSCYLPNTILFHASVVLDQFYRASGNRTCAKEIARIIDYDPSTGSCKFP